MDESNVTKVISILETEAPVPKLQGLHLNVNNSLHIAYNNKAHGQINHSRADDQ